MTEKKKRVRNWALITYHSEEVIKTVLQGNSARIRHWAYIKHDKDTNEDKTLKETHYHVLLQFNNSITMSAVRALFPAGQNTLAQPEYDKVASFLYLNHRNEPDKYQYPDTDIVCNDPDYWKKLQESGEDDDKTVAIIDDIIACVPFRELMRRYGRDLVINYNRYRDFANAVRMEENAAPSIPSNKDIVFKDKTGVQIINGETGETLVKHR